MLSRWSALLFTLEETAWLLTLEEGKKVFVKAKGFKSLYGSSKIADDFNVKYGVYKKPMDLSKAIDASITAK